MEEIDDKYAGPHYLISPASRKLALGLLETKNRRYSVYKMMGDEAGDWLGRAFVGIEDKDVTNDNRQLPLEAAVDLWEPLPIDRGSDEYAEVLAHIEQCVREMAADNGFGSVYPGERDNLVFHAEATLRTVREGTVTRLQVRQNLIAAGRWIAEKFVGTAIGAVGAELAKWALKLLGLIGGSS